MKRDYSTVQLAVMVTIAVMISAAPTPAIVIHEWAMRQAGFHSQDEVRGVAVDTAGNIYIGAQVRRLSTMEDFEIIKYTPGGSTIWRAFFAGYSASDDWLGDMAMDGAGNIYLSGSAWRGGPYSLDYVTLKFNPLGQQVWEAWWDNGPAYNYEGAKALALDHQGDVYVTGSAAGLTGPTDDIVTIKYSSEGIQQWVARFKGPGHRTDQGVDLAVDSEGSVYVVGYSDINFTGTANYDMVIIKYNSQGAQQWATLHGRPGAANDRAIALALDADNNAYVTGNSELSATLSDAILIVKYNSNGIRQWAAQYAGFGSDEAYVNDLVLDADRNVILTGLYHQYGMQDFILTAKYSTNGALLWDEKYQEFAVNNTIGHSIAVDAEQNVYVSGAIANAFYIPECMTMKYKPTGTLEWSAHHIVDSLAEERSTIGRFITLDNQNNVIVAGGICMGGGILDEDLHTIKYSQPSGDFTVAMIPTVSPVIIPAQGGNFNYTLLSINHVMDSLEVDYWWEYEYVESFQPTPLSGIMHAVLPLDSTSIERTQHVRGSMADGTYRYIVHTGAYPGLRWEAADTIMVIKLPPGEEPLVDDHKESGTGKREQQKEFSFFTNPNPFNAATAISYELRVASFVSLKVYDTAGSLVATLLEGLRQAGVHEATFDGSGLAGGIYFVKLEVIPTSGSGATPIMVVQKLALVK